MGRDRERDLNTSLEARPMSNKDLRIAPNQPKPVPPKDQRAQIFGDTIGPLQSGATQRNRYEDGYHLPSQEKRDR